MYIQMEYIDTAVDYLYIFKLGLQINVKFVTILSTSIILNTPII